MSQFGMEQFKNFHIFLTSLIRVLRYTHFVIEQGMIAGFRISLKIV